jgi:uncharacterized protein involved in outer membrane biogenesis
MSRGQKWLAGIGAFLIILFVGLYFLDWNMLRPFIARKVSDATGRSFAINGDLNVHLSLRPRIIVNDIVMGNAEWARELNMAEIKRLDFRIDLLRLIGGHLSFPELALSEPRVRLEVNKDGTPNWVFKEENKDKPTAIPEVGALSIDKGNATYTDPRINTDLTLTSTHWMGSKDRNRWLKLSARGALKACRLRSTHVAARC